MSSENTQSVEAPARSEEKASTAPFVHIRIERELEDAALLTSEFCDPASARAWFLDAAAKAFDRIDNQLMAYRSARERKVTAWSRLTEFAVAVAGSVASTVTITGSGSAGVEAPSSGRGESEANGGQGT